MNWITGGVVFLAAVLGGGCTHTPRESAGLGQTVECSSSDGSATLWVLLSSRGAARVDFLSTYAPRQSFVLPANSEGVERLAANVAALADARGRMPQAAPRNYTARGPRIIHYEGAAGTGTVELSAGEVDGNCVWQGVIDEIRRVGMVEVAAAFRAHAAADSALAEGDRSEAIRAYQEAVRTLGLYMRDCFHRGGGIFEPEVAMEFRYPGREPGWFHVLHGVPDDFMTLPDMTPEWAVKGLQYGWGEYTKDLVASQVGHATVLRLAKDDLVQDWGLTQPEVAPEVVRALLERPGPAATTATGSER